MNMVNFKIDGIPVSVPAGTTILEAAKQAGIKIPTLCYMKDINEIGACRMCVVEAGGRALQAACVYPVEALPKNRVTGEVGHRHFYELPELRTRPRSARPAA